MTPADWDAKIPAGGRVTVGGQVVAGATVALHRWNPETEKFVSVCDGLTDESGRFQLTTYSKFDGAPVGEYAITIVKTGKSYFDREKPVKSPIPEVFAAAATTTLRVPIREGENEMKLDLPGR